MTDFQDTWAALVAEAGRHGSGRIVRRVGPVEGPGTFLAIDCGTKRRWFLAEVEAGREDMHGLPDWREIRAALVGGGAIHGASLGLELASTDYLDVFSALSRDLVSALDGIISQPDRMQAIRDRLQKWSRFLKEHGHRGLSEERVRGLFAELWVLHERVAANLPILESVRAWKGPDADAHDFRREEQAIEVKSAGLSTPSFIAISNEAQLDDAGLATLWLHVVFLDDVAQDGWTLPELVARIRANAQSEPSARTSLNQKLERSGYLDEAASLYTRRYGVVDESSFRVGEGFPRVIRPPAGVHSVKYRLLIDELQPFAVAAPFEAFCAVR